MGLATVHSESSEAVIDRLITLIKKDVRAQYYTENFLRKNISQSVDNVIFMESFKIKNISKILEDGTCEVKFELKDGEYNDKCANCTD